MAYSNVIKGDSIYIKGDPENPRNGDSRIFWDGTDYIMQEYSEGCKCYISTGVKLSRGSVSLGQQLGVSDFGFNAGFTIKRDIGVAYIPPAVGLTKNGLATPCLVGYPEGSFSKTIFFNGTDNIDATLIGDKYVISALVTAGPEAFYIYNQYLTVGNNTPTEPVTFRIYEDLDGNDENKLLVETGLPVSLWSGKNPGDEIKFNFSENQAKEIPIGSRSFVNFYIEYSSDQPFSLYGDGTEVNRAVDSQEITAELSSLDSYKEVDSDITHDRNRVYPVDTTAGSVTITIPFGTVNSLIVLDAAKKFRANSCFVLIKDALGATLHTLELDKKDRGYRIYNNGTVWVYNEIGKGSCVDIASYHKASEDFPGDDSTEYHLEASTAALPINNDGTTYTQIPDMVAFDPVGFTSSGGDLYCTDGGRFLIVGTSTAFVNKAVTITYTLFVNDVAIDHASTPHTFGAASKNESLAITAFAEFNAGDKIQIKAKGDGVATNADLTVTTLDMTFTTRN